MKLLLTTLLLISSMHAQWQKVDVATTAGFRGLNVVSEKIIWASGTEGTVIRTIDGGKTWSVMTVPGAEKLDLRGIKAFDANAAVIISSGPAEKGQAKIFRTIDGGKNWKQVFEEKRAGIFFDAVQFWDKQHGIVLSDPVDGKFALFTTEDGGVTWKQLPPAAVPDALPSEGAFAASNSCLVVQGASNVWFATGGASVARVFHSGDRGKTWQVVETPMHPANASSGIFSLTFKDDKNGVAAGGDYQKPEGADLPNVMLTHDGGKTWQAAEPTDPAGVYFSSVAVMPALETDVLFAAGTKGLVIFAGAWSKPIEQNFNSVAIGPEYHVWVVGPKGSVGQLKMKMAFQR
jgi:photosystem II stability/assembly factor-like uncharacterized protein